MSEAPASANVSITAPAVPPPWRFDRQVSTAVVFAFLVQTGGALLWAGGAAERISAIERRLDRQAGTNERLARLEAEAEASRASLGRIEALLDTRSGPVR
ncbi:MAG: hypothetical protein INR64_11055 [Caulobacteraceae bacterium]|nr:hypothetical protein [Caulobacter sp.]